MVYVLLRRDLACTTTFTIDWNYRYFDTDNVSINDEKNTLEAFVDKKVTNPRLVIMLSAMLNGTHVLLQEHLVTI